MPPRKRNPRRRSGAKLASAATKLVTVDGTPISVSLTSPPIVVADEAAIAMLAGHQLILLSQSDASALTMALLRCLEQLGRRP